MTTANLAKPATHQEADASDKIEPVLLPLAKLRPSPANVRKTAPAAQSIDALAASIDRLGLLQNLIVVRSNGHYEVVAGQRRLAALLLLIKQKRLPKNHAVPCLIVASAAASVVSLTENVQREAMHPADQFEAFAALVAGGRPVEDVAADFGVSPLVVQRRLKLANVSPRLLADYRAAVVTLEQLMALAITDDHAAQEAAFYASSQWQRSASALREHLTADEVNASTDARARFVGADYEAAGGSVRRDLFADDAQGGYLTDPALLDRLALAKLAPMADRVRAEGWAWVEVTAHITSSALYAFERAQRDRAQPTAQQVEQIEQIAARLQAIEDALYGEDDEAEAEAEAMSDEARAALREESARLSAQHGSIEESLLVFSPGVLGVAGAVVTLDAQGVVIVHRGLVRKEDAKALRKAAQSERTAAAGGAGSAQDQAAKPAKATVSESLAKRLSSHRTAALQLTLAQQPDVALVAAVHALAVNTLRPFGYHKRAVALSATRHDQFGSDAPGVAESPAAIGLQAARQAWAERLPADPEELFAVLLDFEQKDLLALLAVCVASSVTVATPKDEVPAASLARAVGLDMRPWWTATAAGYFSHVSKAAILDAAQSFAPDALTRLAKMKKQEMAAEAERLCTDTGWLPAMLRPPTAPAANDSQ